MEKHSAFWHAVGSITVPLASVMAAIAAVVFIVAFIKRRNELISCLDAPRRAGLSAALERYVTISDACVEKRRSKFWWWLFAPEYLRAREAAYDAALVEIEKIKLFESRGSFGTRDCLAYQRMSVQMHYYDCFLQRLASKKGMKDAVLDGWKYLEALGLVDLRICLHAKIVELFTKYALHTLRAEGYENFSLVIKEAHVHALDGHAFSTSKIFAEFLCRKILIDHQQEIAERIAAAVKRAIVCLLAEERIQKLELIQSSFVLSSRKSSGVAYGIEAIDGAKKLLDRECDKQYLYLIRNTSVLTEKKKYVEKIRDARTKGLELGEVLKLESAS